MLELPSKSQKVHVTLALDAIRVSFSFVDKYNWIRKGHKHHYADYLGFDISSS